MKLRHFFTFLFLCIFTPIYGAFSANETEGVVLSGTTSGTNYGDVSSDPKTETGSKKDEKKGTKKPIVKEDKDNPVIETEDFPKEEKEKVQKEINLFIIQLLTIQDNKSLRKIDAFLQQEGFDVDQKIETYRNLQMTYVLRKRRVLSGNGMTSNNRAILTAYFDYIITALEKRQDELRK